MTVITECFTRAVDYARIAHAGQVRKGSNIPYLKLAGVLERRPIEEFVVRQPCG